MDPPLNNNNNNNNNKLTEGYFINPCWRLTEISKFSSAKVQLFFKTPVTYFLKCFRDKFREILASGSREIGAFPRKLFLHLTEFFRLQTKI